MATYHCNTLGWALAWVLALPLAAQGHGDEDHGAPVAARPQAGGQESPRRLAGGQVMLPKALQHA